MFQQFKNIDSAFKHIRLFSLLFLTSTLVICLFTIYQTTVTIQKGQQKVYILLNGKLLDAMAIDRSDSLAVELRDHVKMFHYYFYALQPDDEVNKKHITSALYLADNTARSEYNNLMESGYYLNIVAGNISQDVLEPDSIQVDINHAPYYFRYYGKLKITRATSILTCSLLANGRLHPPDHH